MGRFFHRMGDGSAVDMTDKEIMADLVEGSEDAAERGVSVTPHAHFFPGRVPRYHCRWGNSRGGGRDLLTCCTAGAPTAPGIAWFIWEAHFCCIASTASSR